MLGERFIAHLPFWVGAGAVLVAAGVLAATRGHLAGIDAEEDDAVENQALAITFGSDS
jgi:hypothetical protein